MLQFSETSAQGSLDTAVPAAKINPSLSSRAGVISAGCPAVAPTPPQPVELGASFEGLPRELTREECTKPPPDLRDVVSGPRIPVAHSLVVYGSCQPPGSASGCLPPLQLQSWPECARNPNSYIPAPGTATLEGVPVEGQEPEPLQLPAAPQIPVASFDEGRRLEVYGGNTTVVVFAEEPDLARRAVTAVARTLALASPSSASVLRRDAAAPGDGSSCPPGN